MTDIYFDLQYAKLYEQIENGVACQWKYEGSEGEAEHIFIKREIPWSVHGEKYYDLITPYGYGGPRIVRLADGYCKQDLVHAFEKNFAKYCRENRIVSEFVRFYPLCENAADFAEVYNSTLNRHTLGTNLRDYDDPVQAEFSKSCRKSIRNALKQGVSFRITQCPDDLDEFVRIYYMNMERKQADEFYFFEKRYFDDVLSSFKENVLLGEALYDNKTIAAGLFFLSNHVIHVHLSGTDTDFLHLSPAYVLRYGMVLWGKEHNCHLVHHGGGLSPSENDPLFLYKKRFAANTEFPFYLGKRIWDEAVYDELCCFAGADPDADFFPAYRSKHC